MKTNKDLTSYLSSLGGDSTLFTLPVADFLQPVLSSYELSHSLPHRTSQRFFWSYTSSAGVGNTSCFFFTPTTGCWIRKFYLISVTAVTWSFSQGINVTFPLAVNDPITAGVIVAPEETEFSRTGSGPPQTNFVPGNPFGFPPLFTNFAAGQTTSGPDTGPIVTGNTTRGPIFEDLWLPRGITFTVKASAVNQAIGPLYVDLEFPVDSLYLSTCK